MELLVEAVLPLNVWAPEEVRRTLLPAQIDGLLTESERVGLGKTLIVTEADF